MIYKHFVGVDISKAKFDASLMTNETHKHRTFDNSPSGFKLFESWLNKYADKPNVHISMEATGHYSEPLAEYLVSQKLAVSVLNPLVIKHFGRFKLTRSKTDKLDSLLIAQFGEQEKPALFKPRCKLQKKFRDAVQLIDSLKDQCVQLSNKRASMFSKEIIRTLNSMIKQHEKAIERLKLKLSGWLAKDEQFLSRYTLLISIKGFGDLTVYRLLAFLPDLSLFQTAKQLACYSGLSPRIFESGQYKGTTRISKKGNKYLRKTLYMPALSILARNEAFQPFIRRLEHNQVNRKAIVIAIMRKLIHIIFGMLKKQQAFDPALVSGR